MGRILATKQNTFNNIKKKIYLATIPIIILATISGLLHDSVAPMQYYSLLALVIWLIIFLGVTLFFNRLIPLFELITFIFLIIYHNVRFYLLLSDGIFLTDYNVIDIYVFWYPIFYIFIFLIFRHTKALIVSFILYALSITVGIFVYSFYSIENIGDNFTLIHLYLSNLVIIVALYVLLSIVESYNKSRDFEKMAYTDLLTEIYNRRKLYDLINTEISNKKNFQNGSSVIIFDIDNFKKINDKYGHMAGDHVLIEFSRIVQNIVTDNEHFGRWGGEEFLILCPKKDKNQAKELAEKLREKTEKHHFQYVNTVTASFGITQFQKGDNISSLINRADLALYTSKQNGRNQVTIYEDPDSH
ncbi:GGDEF domain-containing protein [Evansella tamaricis]|uniref:Diguanylate cyclase n=1 Tax=Evansella tamaricis TaxID=2069301 RepID=A0ABS6JGY5_9BACI|nr:diguanylate cyclase [Evansella tamaricis]MBU9711593.1 diguanylate cyclase [Evansella tamaricis]